MPDRTIVLETDAGHQLVAATSIRCRGPDGSFISRADFDRALRADHADATGYGAGEYGAGDYGSQR